MRKANIQRMKQTDGYIIREQRRARRAFRHRSWVWFMRKSAAIWAGVLLLVACGGKVERDPPGITALCWVECVRFVGGSHECVVLDSPEDLEDDSFWGKVEAIERDHACPALPGDHALVGNGE